MFTESETSQSAVDSTTDSTGSGDNATAEDAAEGTSSGSTGWFGAYSAGSESGQRNANPSPRSPRGALFSNGVDELRQNDLNLLRELDIKYICDLMVENKKKK